MINKTIHNAPFQTAEFNKRIKFRTIVGWLIGKRIEVKFSYGASTSFFVSDQIEENKHWATFIEKEIYEWEYL